jgi:hypothetical protein
MDNPEKMATQDTNKQKNIKGELRRCKVKNKQKRYQRGTQKVKSEEQTKKLSKVLFVLHLTPSEFPFDICFVCSSLYTF